MKKKKLKKNSKQMDEKLGYDSMCETWGGWKK